MPSVRIGILREFSGVVSASGLGCWFWLLVSADGFGRCGLIQFTRTPEKLVQWFRMSLCLAPTMLLLML